MACAWPGVADGDDDDDPQLRLLDSCSDPDADEAPVGFPASDVHHGSHGDDLVEL